MNTPSWPRIAAWFRTVQRPAKSRGLCASHYQTAYQLVCSGAVTWQQLEDSGKCERTASAKQWFLECAK